MFLRKRIESCKITSIGQVPDERILVAKLQGKEGRQLIIELFGTGNIILCTEDGIIEGALVSRAWKGRTIAKGVGYVPPERKESAGHEQTISKYLAVECGYGRRWALEICTRLGVGPEEKASKGLAAEAVTLAKKLFAARTSFSVVMAKDRFVEPFRFESVTAERQEVPSFSAGLAQIARTDGNEVVHEDSEEDRLKGAIAVQEKVQKEHIARSAAYEECANAMYANYSELSMILERARATRKDRKSLSVLKGNSFGTWHVVDADDIEKTVTVENKSANR